MWTDLRAAADRFIHHRAVEYSILVLIVASVVMLILEISSSPSPAVRSFLVVGGNVITAVFAVELAIRFWVARKKQRFFRRYWVDILSVLPLARPLRLLRVLRLFRAGILIRRRVGGLDAFRAELMALGSVTIVLVLCGGVLVHIAEADTNPEFASLGASMWFAVYSLIGGEPIGGSPTTLVGEWVTLVLMVGGLTVFGMFVGTVSAGMVSRLSTSMEVHELALDELDGHVIVCGWNRSAATVVRELFGPHSPESRAVVVITEQADKPVDFPQQHVRVEHLYHHHGDWTLVDVLYEVGVERADVALLLTDDLTPRSDQDRDARTVLAALTIESINKDIYTVAELTTRQNEEMLKRAGVEEIVVGDWYAGVILGSSARNRGLVRVLDEILTARHGNAFHTLRVPDTVVGKTVEHLHNELRREHGAVLISIENAAGFIVVNPDGERLVDAGDRVVVLAEESVEEWGA